ncbi:DUF7322 domain-containing protein [Natronobiforma cellulositropha]|uniref:DUF7322 domain-containing protein n=1 Tax=Natronobiforma cellulositropha TaxID=1679076 RepID=UPI0021D5F16A|nr:hypothetical protein [Natronobiforma cellulositropha]
MLFERTEHEPDEYDPEEDLYDPKTDSLTVPQVDADLEDVPAEVQRPFWLAVLGIKGGVMAGGVGAVLLAAGYDQSIGLALVVAGAAFFALALYRIRVFSASLEQLDEETDDGEPSEPAGEAGNGEDTDGPAETGDPDGPADEP